MTHFDTLLSDIRHKKDGRFMTHIRHKKVVYDRNRHTYVRCTSQKPEGDWMTDIKISTISTLADILNSTLKFYGGCVQKKIRRIRHKTASEQNRALEFERF